MSSSARRDSHRVSSLSTTIAAELSTERLTLRAWTADEVADVLAEPTATG